MSFDFEMVQGDRLPVLERQLVDLDGNPIADLTGFTIEFIFRRIAEAVIGSVNSATLVDGPTARVSYAWAAGDLATAGRYEGRFRATAGGLELSVPSGTTLLWLVTPNIVIA